MTELILILGGDEYSRLKRQEREHAARAVDCLLDGDRAGWAEIKAKADAFGELATEARRKADEGNRQTAKALDRLLERAGRTPDAG
jgi:hypothetical protein